MKKMREEVSVFHPGHQLMSRSGGPGQGLGERGHCLWLSWPCPLYQGWQGKERQPSLTCYTCSVQLQRA